ncbi:unnamed protein product [Heterosigma akashiwo]|mmetsp:Transcript_23314/g.32319  ORF Transcript_23314/g.32319 Transcript_23314/m.32319 type:complete len:185 (+) Transcript_23314:76-630(+)
MNVGTDEIEFVAELLNQAGDGKIPGTDVNDADLFPYLNYALVGWFFLVFLPRWNGTRYVVMVVCLAVSSLYAILMANVMFSSTPEESSSSGALDLLKDFSTFEGVVKLFQNKDVVLGAWSHYVCFDLWVGYWEVEDAAEKGIPHILVVPCLFFTLMLGPTGFLMYFTLRLVFILFFNARKRKRN